MARSALNNPYYPNFNAKKMSKVDSIENVNELVDHALSTPYPIYNQYNLQKPEQIAIKAFINHMGPDLTGPNFNQTEVETVDVLAKRAKHNLFGADETDTKSITESLTKDED